MKAFLTIVLLIVGCFANAATRDTIGNKSLLWKISGNGLAQPSYLFGTIHIICPDDFLWTDTMAKYLHAAKKVCFEMNLSDPQVLAEIMRVYSDTSLQPAQVSLTELERKDALRILRDSLHMDADDAMLASPMALQSMMLTKMLRCNMPASYESHIMTDALKSDKQVLGLESAQEQIAAFNAMQSDSSGAQLLETLHSLQQERALFCSMVAAYVAQDLPRLYGFIIQSPELKGALTILLDDRNRRWISRMEPVMREQSTFYAVGAGHLWGEAGVINLLRKAGYKVAPLR